ncbi:MAG: hypothetical protein WKF60_08280 [Ilumatobacter sp.]
MIESSDELTETLVCDCGCLLDEYSSLVITDGDRRRKILGGDERNVGAASTVDSIRSSDCSSTA